MPKPLRALKSPVNTKMPLLMGSDGKRLSASRSTGDLTGFLKEEFLPRRPVTLNLNSTEVPATSPRMEDTMVCGFLYRLGSTGIWYRQWVELRFNYLMGFYQQTDTFPVDVINLEGYSVKKAEECDHLEGLYPLKLFKKGEKMIFFYTESEESRLEWMCNFKRTAKNQEKKSLDIDGLNLELEKPILEKNSMNRRSSTVIRNIDNKVISNVTIFEDEFDSSEKSMMTFDASQIQNINNKYNIAQALTQHEALRLSTYYWQRRESAQIKVDTLKQVLQDQNSNEKEEVKEKIIELKTKLNDIEHLRENAERAAGKMLKKLESKRAKELQSVNAPEQTEKSPVDVTVKVITEEIDQSERTDQSDQVNQPDQIYQPPSPKKFKSPKSPKIVLHRRSFSPGDAVCNGEGNITSPKAKLSSPFKMLSNAVRSHSKKEINGDLSPCEPLKSPQFGRMSGSCWFENPSQIPTFGPCPSSPQLLRSPTPYTYALDAFLRTPPIPHASPRMKSCYETTVQILNIFSPKIFNIFF